MPPMMVFILHEGPLSVYLIHDLAFSTHFYALLFTINTLIIVFLEILLNVAMVQFSHRACIMIGSVLISLGFAGLVFTKSAMGIIFLAVIWTFGEMILFPSASAFVSELAAENVRGSYMGMYNTASNIAIMLGLWLGSVIMGYWGATSLWVISGIWGLVSLLFFIRLPGHLKTG
jgi:MFS family permease